MDRSGRQPECDRLTIETATCPNPGNRRRAMNLAGKTILITGGARRIGRAISLAVAEAGADVIVHYGSSPEQADQTGKDIRAMGRRAWILQADLEDPSQVAGVMEKANELAPVDALINNAAIFLPGDVLSTSLGTWQQHIAINLTAPFLLSQVFARLLPPEREGHILNLLDWRALRPGSDHFAYTISKAALAAMTQSLAVSLAPHIIVNGLALGAILPPADGSKTADILRNVPAARWADLKEVGQGVVFLLSGPSY
ncbi:SDR family NAD(P)-dependent oxidoreductase, partial [bacterium]|nr:SDR family NAD(P)-dependent oxidoreductase [bacterium]